MAVRSPEEVWARRIAAERLAWERKYRTDETAFVLFARAARIAAGAASTSVRENDLAQARAFAEAERLLYQRGLRAMHARRRAVA